MIDRRTEDRLWAVGTPCGMRYAAPMEVRFRPADFNGDAELMFIAEQDSKIPQTYEGGDWNEKSVLARLDLYRRLDPKDDFFDVAVDDSKIIGFHIIKKIPSPPDKLAGLIITLWVDPRFRGKGIATQLKQRGEEWARSHKFEHLQTGVHSNNSRMISLNQKSGFQTFQVTMKKKL
jgi:GNAT superfamily N-acetyltransferase